MPLEFALRPRIRLSEGTAPPRRPRWRIPKLALPIAAYWSTAAGITYGLIQLHDQPAAPAPAQAAPAALETKPNHEWWQPIPARPAPTATEPELAAPLPKPSALAAGPEIEPAPIAEEPPLEPEGPFAAPALPRELPLKGASRERSSAEAHADSAAGSSALAGVAIPAPDLLPLSRVARLARLAPLGQEPAPEAPPLLAATPPDAPASVASALPSCEAAAAAERREIDVGQRDDTPDLSRAAIATVLDNGVWIARCDIPMSTSIELCVAIKEGKVIGVSVASHPASAAISACVKRRAAGLHFPFSSRVDLAKTHF